MRLRTISKLHVLWTLAACAWSNISSADSLYKGFTYQGRFLSADGTQPMTDTVDLVIGIYSPNGNCLLYEERHTNIDLSQTSGLFSVHVGSGVGDPKRVAGRDPGKELTLIFSNSGEIRGAGANCDAGYTPSSGDPRKLRVTVHPHGGSAETMTPDLTITPLPQATVAETLQGLDPTKFVQISGATSSYSVSKAAFDSLSGMNGVQDASSLHHHDSVYAQLGLDGTIAIGDGKYLGLGAHNANPDTTGWQTDPTKIGRTWFDSTTKEIKFWDGTSVKSLGISGAAVNTFNTRSGAVTLLSADVTGALGFTPQNAANLGADTKASLAETANNPVKYSTVSGSFYLQAGVTAGDTLKWDGSQWQVGADTRHWSLNGSDVYRGSGSVGIGTSTPAALLEVQGDANQFRITGDTARAKLNRPNLGGTNGFDFQTGGTWDWAFGSTQGGSRNLYFRSSSGGSIDVLTLAYTGNVGIGVTNPNALLHILKNLDTDIGQTIENTYGGAYATSKLMLKNSYGGASSGALSYSGQYYNNFNDLGTPLTPYQLTLITDTNASGGILIGSRSSAAPIKFATAPSGTFTEVMRIQPSGNVGIGTTAPKVSLDLSAKTDALAPPKGTTAQQPTCDATNEGVFRYNSETKLMEFCNGTIWRMLPAVQSAAQTAPAGVGYFVLSNGTFNGNRGGLTGANNNCLTDLTNNDWMGKATAVANGQLVANKVKAFLCDSSSCNNLLPLATYAFATSGDVTAGGATFTTDATGAGPGDSVAWSSANYFQASAEYWTNRNPGTATVWGNSNYNNGNSANETSCWSGIGWGTNNSGNRATYGNSSQTGWGRWGGLWPGWTRTCDTPLHLICMVNP